LIIIIAFFSLPELFFLLLCRPVLELAATIKSTFEPVVQTHLYPRSQIDIFVQVLQQDGGLLQACINGATLALANAGIPLLDFVCAITGGVHATAPMLDLTALEESDVPSMTVAVMPRSGRVTLVALESRLHVERFEEVFRLACEAGKVLHKEMRGAVRARAGSLVMAMGTGVIGEASNAEHDIRGEADF
jgi:exosome complex component RRP41